VIEDIKGETSTDVVIYEVPPGLYSEADEGEKTALIKLDGIQLEKMEVATVVYYWLNRHFESLITSD
jgi:hypothetical protein